MTESTMVEQGDTTRVRVWRGVPSQSFLEQSAGEPRVAHDLATTWRMRRHDAYEDARWSVDEGEPAYLEGGLVDLPHDLEKLEARFAPNWTRGILTIPPGDVDVDEFDAAGVGVSEDEVVEFHQELVEALGEDGLAELADRVLRDPDDDEDDE